MFTKTSSVPKMRQVVNRLKKVSEMKPPTRESKKVVPMKLVTVVEEPERSKCITAMKYKTKLTMLATNPMFSNDAKTVVRTQNDILVFNL